MSVAASREFALRAGALAMTTTSKPAITLMASPSHAALMILRPRFRLTAPPNLRPQTKPTLVGRSVRRMHTVRTLVEDRAPESSTRRKSAVRRIVAGRAMGERVVRVRDNELPLGKGTLRPTAFRDPCFASAPGRAGRLGFASGSGTRESCFACDCSVGRCASTFLNSQPCPHTAARARTSRRQAPSIPGGRACLLDSGSVRQLWKKVAKTRVTPWRLATARRYNPARLGRPSNPPSSERPNVSTTVERACG
jgi:hypothetical protein